MQKFRFLVILLVLCSILFAFSIESYYSQVTVLPNGDLAIYEKMNFTLEKVYNEGYRSIRPADYDNLSNIRVSSALLNGRAVPFSVGKNGRNAEIVWTRTVKGTNLVELNYTLKNRVELYSDFARVCYEHLGSNWPSDVNSFDSKMILPASAARNPIHFQIYSDIKGDAHLVGSSIVTHIDDVYSGTYVGGCYLFDRSSVNSSRLVNGSAYDLLQSDRDSYGSTSIPVSTALISYSLFCPSFLFLLFLLLLSLVPGHFRSKGLTESILPPDDSEPVDVAVLLRGDVNRQHIASATILELINKGSIEILELEKKDAPKTGAISREETILFLKNKKDLAPHQLAMVDLIFGDATQVNLDKLVADYDKIKVQSDAQDLDLEDRMRKYKASISVLLDKKENRKIINDRNGRIVICFVSAFLLFFMTGMSEALDLTDAFSGLFFAIFSGNLVAMSYLLILPLIIVPLCYLFVNKRPTVDSEAYWQWDAFERGLKSSRIKEYPPSATVIWGKILVYATALGLAKAVNTHLSEVDALTRSKLEKMQSVSISSSHFYASTLALTNLAAYGSRSGPSSRSSGGWSSGGGGGFSSSSSGGGGFR
ncbi:DUF2207 domain-containing protein [Candidatus Micrarchaeota archaeon]|nr:DUF2207 domain-containing protein [Candidatus Micrarchaeota archaeon]